jgi:hypothetical protein
MASRASVTDFISQINAKPGYSATVNADGSAAISKNGAVIHPKVFWNIVSSPFSGGSAGPSLQAPAIPPWPQPKPVPINPNPTPPGWAENHTVSGFCDMTVGRYGGNYPSVSGYPTDQVTFVDGGTATTAAAQDFLNGLR